MHFFWIFGHPEVYVLIIPCFAFASEIIPVFSRKPIFGYPVMVAATIAIGFISLSVWAHHMFTVGMSSYGNTFFTITTMIISIPTGIKIFNWIGTMWGGKIQFKAPMLFCVGFLFQFLIAGTVQLAIERVIFCGGAFSLRDRRRNSVHRFWSLLLLVPKNEREDVQRDAREMAFLAVPDWFSPDI
jgi:cytochrome c oxidase subunit 1